ncbi:MAG: DHH family phosphoesterase, partial [Candidatus Omnitrophota bacterium]
MKSHWSVSAPKPELIGALADQTSLTPAIVSILVNRGFSDAGAIGEFVRPKLEHLEPPSAFAQMERFVGRLKAAIEKKQSILLYGDYDVDGVSSTAMLYLYLRSLGVDCHAYLPNRFTDGYGLSKVSAERLAKTQYDLWICLDNGSSSHDAIRFLADKQIDVLVVDHHLSPSREDLPAAYALLNPKLESFAPKSASMTTCGIVFKLIWAMAGDLTAAAPYLDLTALGTVADVADITGDNRILTRLGLAALRSTKRVGLVALMRTSQILPAFLSAKDIAFSLSPMINAAGRLGTPDEAFKLLTTQNPLEAANLAKLLAQNNLERQKIERTAYEEAVELIEEDPVAAQQNILVVE